MESALTVNRKKLTRLGRDTRGVLEPLHPTVSKVAQMQPTPGHPELGLITLPLALCCMVLTLFLIRLLSAQLHVLAGIGHDTSEAHNLHEAARGEIIAAPPAVGSCHPYTAHTKKFTGSWSACAAERLPFRTLPLLTGEVPTPDFDALLAAAQPCPGVARVAATTTFSAPISPTTCLPASPLKLPFFSLDNIFLAEASSSRTTTSAQILFATPGALTIEDSLTLASDGVIVAGGSIRIGRIIATSDSVVHLTVISSLGAIEIGAASGQLSLLVAGRGDLRAPVTPVHAPYPLPPSRLPQVVGIATQAEPAP